jgi:hypothetical protein
MPAKKIFEGTEIQLAKPLIQYAVINENNEFYVNWGYRASAPNWTSDINNAKLYKSPGGARNLITSYGKQLPGKILPNLAVISSSGVLVVDETLRVEKAKMRQQKIEDERELCQIKDQIKRAKENEQRAKEDLKKANEALASKVASSFQPSK